MELLCPLSGVLGLSQGRFIYGRPLHPKYPKPPLNDDLLISLDMKKLKSGFLSLTFIMPFNNLNLLYL